MSKQTAVEWLVNHWKKLQLEGEKMSWSQIIDITELAKQKEKEQIISARQDGFESTFSGCDSGCGGGFYLENTSEEYYNETYKGGEQ